MEWFGLPESSFTGESQPQGWVGVCVCWELGLEGREGSRSLFALPLTPSILFLLLRKKGQGEWEALRKNRFKISLQVTPAMGPSLSYPVSLPPSRDP